METLVVIAGGLLVGGYLIYRLIRAIPPAYAWDPNSHDKMTLYALDLLEREENKTLLGWVLKLSRQHPAGQYFKHCIESQIRRGSVEEDMSSYLLTRQTYTLLGLDTLEGANGGYHFYNPEREEAGQRGLTDPTFFLWLLGKKLSACATPMPSAVHRAYTASQTKIMDPGWGGGWPSIMEYFGKTPGTNWHLDNEYRNYSVQDASNYYRLGYSHLGFYAIGRIAHLLQDMTVPAHVRDDAHPGGAVQKLGFDPADPLETFADLEDVPAHESDRHLHKWAFDPERIYESSQSPIGAAGQGVWLNHRDGFPAPTPDLFHTLAKITHNNHYSYNTIPGNVNSHDPQNTANQPLARTVGVDWQKCAPSSDGLLEVFRQFLRESQTICLELAKDIGNLASPSPSDQPKVLKYQTLMQKVQPLSNLIATAKLRESKYQNIIGICPKYHFPSPSLRPMIQALTALYDEIKPIGEELGPIAHQNALGFARRYEIMELTGLLAACDRAAGPASSEPDRDRLTEEIIRHWIDAFPNVSVLGEVFDVAVTPWSPAFQEIKNNGPCCFTEELIREQWLRTQPYGVGFTAILLSTWFERQLRMGGNGLVTWQNKDMGDSQTKPPVEPLGGEVNNQTMTADKVATIGIAHGLPLAVDLAVEITMVEEGTDPLVWEEGVELELTWGRSRPDTFTQLLGLDIPADIIPQEPGIAGGSIDPGVGHDWFKTKHYVSQSLGTYVMKEGRGNLSWQVQDLETVFFCGAEDPPGVTSKTLYPPAADPYNLEAMLRLPLPRGIWSPAYTEMGGITREVENDAGSFPPLELFGDDKSALSKLSTGFLRIQPRLKSASSKPLETPNSATGDKDKD